MPRAYLDNNATTPMDPRVVGRMVDVLSADYGNPSSLHAFGRSARRVIEDARASVAALTGVEAKEIVFTSSATEANNLAIFGLARAAPPARRVIVASPIEHASVLSPLRRLEKEGFTLRFLPVTRDGIVDLSRAAELFGPDTAFATLLWTQNETGVVQPVHELAALAEKAQCPMHSDAVQAAGKIPVSFAVPGLAMATLSAHKFHGPKGAGALWIRSGVRWVSSLVGGGQERDRRAGTENTAAIAGLGLAADLARAEMSARLEKIRALESQCLAAVVDAWPGARLNTFDRARAPGTLNVFFPRAQGEALLMNLDLSGVAVSLGAACSSGAIEASHVLKAMGLTQEENYGSLRISISSMNSASDVEALHAALGDLHLRSTRTRDSAR